jgi:hypothetical protein
MASVAKGAFEVKLLPEKSDEYIARMTIDKVFKGDLQATSIGQMLSASTEVQGSAAYVAMERVVGTLHNKHGSFVLQHRGTMNRGSSELSIKVVPDSATGELVGLSGQMKIIISDSHHSYEFEYEMA